MRHKSQTSPLSHCLKCGLNLLWKLPRNSWKAAPQLCLNSHVEKRAITLNRRKQSTRLQPQLANFFQRCKDLKIILSRLNFSIRTFHFKLNFHWTRQKSPSTFEYIRKSTPRKSLVRLLKTPGGKRKQQPAARPTQKRPERPHRAGAPLGGKKF